MELKDLIKQLPSNVSGDGKNFVSALKKILNFLEGDTEEKIESAVASNTVGGVQYVTDLQLQEEHPSAGQNDVRVRFNTGNIISYSGADIYLKVNDGAWSKVGSTDGNQYYITNLAANSTCYVKVIAKGFESAFDDAPFSYIKIKGNVLICSTPQQFYCEYENNEVVWRWTGYQDNGYTDLFEVRLDQSPGVSNENLIGQTRDKDYVIKAPRYNYGTAYLYVRNVFGNYNTPVEHIFNLDDGNKKPRTPVLYNKVRGVEVHMASLPAGCSGYRLEIDGEIYETPANTFFYYKTAGTIKIRYCFMSGTNTYAYSDYVESVIASLPMRIGESDIMDNAITEEKISPGSVMTKHLFADTIEMSGNLAIAGGNVRLDGNGLHCNMTNGSTINFNTNGMSIQDSNGKVFSQICRWAMGQVAHNQTITLDWDVVPKAVFLVPYNLQTMANGYTSSNIFVKCFADNVTAKSFVGKCYTTISSGSYATQTTSYTSKVQAAETITTDTMSVQTPAGATSTSVKVSVEASGFIYEWKEVGGNGGYITLVVSSLEALYVDIYVNGALNRTITVVTGGDYHYSSYKYGSSYGGTVDTTIPHPQGATIGIRTRCICSEYDYNVTVIQQAATITSNVTGDVVISQGSATYFAIG